MQFRIAQICDIDGILRLHDANHFDNVAENERGDGFVTIDLNDAQVRTLVNDETVFVAQNDGEIVGYVLCGGWDFYAQWPIFPHLIARMEGETWNGFPLGAQSTFQYGPVCVAKSWRGQGVLPQLFQVLRDNMAPRFPVGLTFINAQNTRSLVAHRKLGMEAIDEWSFNERDYFTLAFRTRDL